jgi:flagellar hook-associated protein 1
MRSTFAGIETTRRALMASQGALDTVSHNISNSNTPGYSRQVASLTTTSPYTVPSMYKSPIPGQIGTGVEIQSITRTRNEFLDLQFRRENKTAGYWETQKENLGKVEGVFNDPSDTGFQTVLNQFWESLQELSKTPQLDAVRSNVRQRAINLTETFNQAYSSLTQQQDDLNTEIDTQTKEVNRIAYQIADLNREIVRVEGTDDHANDLRDKRDLLVDDLSKLINVQVNEQPNGSVNIGTVGQTLICGDFVNEMTTTTTIGPNGQQLLMPVWQRNGLPITFDTGTIGGLLDARDNDVSTGDAKNGIQGYITQLNDLAQALIEDVNTQHALGFDFAGAAGGAFFDPTVPVPPNYAKTFKVAAGILANPQLIAAAGTPGGAPGNGDNALKLAQLSTAPNVAVLGNRTYEDYYKSMIAQLGVDSDAAIQFTTNQDLLTSTIDNQRQSVSGVSLDEEMTSMIKFQKVYSSAARMMTTYDEMLDTIINNMGRVGR